MIRSFEDLQVYQRSKKLFSELVSVTREFPSDGQYLSVQLNRSANSTHANIAEGFGRSTAEFKQYLRRSLGSNNETLSHLQDAYLAGYLKKSQYDHFKGDYTILGKQLYRLRENWNSNI